MKQLNGWWRLWIVVSLAMGVLAVASFRIPETEFSIVTPVAITGHPSDKYKIANSADAGAIQSKWREGCLTTPVSLDSKSMRESDKLEKLEPGEFEIKSRASCVKFRETGLFVIKVLLGPAILLAIGLAFAWVRKGFHQSGSS